jgi:endonuclease/exonuclease/phosphatase family metal-dependent hydrolase
MPVNKKSIFGRIFNSTVFTINVVTIILLLLSAYSDRVSPVNFVVFSFLGMGFPFFLLINILFLLWGLIFFRWQQMFVCLAGILLCWEAVNTYFPLHSRTKEMPENCIKVLTYNVMGFHNSKPHKKSSPNPVLRFIMESNADIVCVQEYRVYENMDLLSSNDLKHALSMYPYSYFYRIETQSYALGDYGMAVYSRFPILSTRKIEFGSEFNGAFLSELDVNGKKVSLINCHLETNRLSDEERKQYSDFVKNPDSKMIDAVAENAVKKLKPAFKTRALQAEKVAKIIRSQTNPYIIVCGDFNDTPISYARHAIKEKLKDAFAETGFGPGITYNQNRFYFRIDYILHSENIKAFNCSVGKLKDSDHYPVWAWLELK